MKNNSKEESEEFEIICSFNQGNVQSFENIIYMFQKELTYLALSIVHHKETAEEIVNDSFLKIWNRRDKFNSIKELKSYLYITVKNGCLDFIKSPKNNTSLFVQAEEYSVPSLENIESKLIYSELLGLLMREIDKLPEKQRKVFVLSYIDGLSVKEIAKEMNISENAVSINKYEATKTIRTLFKGQYSLLLLTCLFSI